MPVNPQVNFANWVSDLPHPIAADLDMTDEVLLLHVPSNLAEIKRRDLNIAARWRNTTRAIFESYFNQRYVVTGFACDKDQTKTNDPPYISLPSP